MNDEIPWAYVAMIFIAFVSWVYGRLKEAAEIRRARAAAKRAAQEARNRAQPTPPPSPYRSPTPTPVPAPVPTQPVTQAPAPVPASGMETPRTFRELFEMLQEQAAPAPKETPRPYAPPPLPVPVAPVQSEADRIFYGPGKAEKVAEPLKVERVRGKTSSNLNRILKNRGTLREALILKEILDVPVAMRE
jgi:hypothetical protein